MAIFLGHKDSLSVFYELSDFLYYYWLVGWILIYIYLHNLHLYLFILLTLENLLNCPPPNNLINQIQEFKQFPVCC